MHDGVIIRNNQTFSLVNQQNIFTRKKWQQKKEIQQEK